MIHHYFWPTPNGHKTSIMLEELGLEFELHPVNILAGEQFSDEFLDISPNNRIPAIVDTDGPGGEPYALFESGAILMYLAEKTGQLWPEDTAERYRVIQWLMFQMGNVGPMFGQNGYFQGYCPEDVPLARERYHNLTLQLYAVLDRRLASAVYLAGDSYSIADIATYPWTVARQQALHRIDIDEFPHVARWLERLADRPAVKRGMALLAEDLKVGDPTEEAYDNMFGATQFEDHRQ
jgi:GST-like protein